MSTSEWRIMLISSTYGMVAFNLSFVLLNSLRNFSRMCMLPSNSSSLKLLSSSNSDPSESSEKYLDCKLYKISGQGVTWKLTKYVWGSVQNVYISVLQDKKETCKSSKALVGYNLMVKDP